MRLFLNDGVNLEFIEQNDGLSNMIESLFFGELATNEVGTYVDVLALSRCRGRHCQNAFFVRLNGINQRSASSLLAGFEVRRLQNYEQHLNVETNNVLSASSV